MQNYKSNNEIYNFENDFDKIHKQIIFFFILVFIFFGLFFIFTHM